MSKLIGFFSALAISSYFLTVIIDHPVYPSNGQYTALKLDLIILPLFAV